MPTEPTAVPAASPAAFTRYLCELPPETRGDYVATENGRPWARVSVAPHGSRALSAFPVGAAGERGDTTRRGQSGVVLSHFHGAASERRHAAGVVAERARRMYRP